MGLLVLKLVLTPFFIGGASLGARRFGPAFGGWIISLPLTSGPVALFVALDRGTGFAASTAEASLAGCIAIAAYASVYARTAGGRRWQAALAASLGAWLVAAVALQPTLDWPLPLLFAVVTLAIVIAWRLMPALTPREPSPTWSRWDVPLRMVVATAVVIVVTAAAPLVGAGVSGLLAMLPIMSTILAVFAHRAGGGADGVAIQRGILSGLFGTAAFLGVIAASIERLGIAASFGLALVTVVVIQAAVLLTLRARSQARSPELA